MGFEADALRLRRAIRDLVAVSTVPAVWAGREPRAIAAGLVDVLVNALYLDFAFVRLCDPTGGAAVEIARGRPLATPRDSAPASHLLMSRVRMDTPRCTNPAI